MPRKYSLDETAFDLLGPESSYWTGFLYADGCVERTTVNSGKTFSYTLTTSLATADEDHLYALQRFLKTDKPVRRYVAGGQYPYSRLRVSSERMCLRLMELGVVPRKSYEGAGAPTFLRTSDDYWRGVVDGDGHLVLGKHPILGLTGDVHTVNQFREFCVESGIRTRATPRQWNNHYVFTLQGSPCIDAVRLLYSGAALGLPRKLRLAGKIMAEEFEAMEPAA